MSIRADPLLQASEKMKKLNVEFASAHSLSATLQLFAIGGLVEYGLWLAKYGLGEMSLCVCSGCSFVCGLVLTRTPSAASASSARKRRQCISNPSASVCAVKGRRNATPSPSVVLCTRLRLTAAPLVVL